MLNIKDRFIELTFEDSLFSFAKYLELLVYSPAIINLSPPLCEHTTAPPRTEPKPDPPLPATRTDIVRNFRHKGRQLSFTVSVIDDIFEVSVPRLQIIRGKPAENENHAVDEPILPLEPERRALRREIMKWWQGLSEHMDELVSYVLHPRQLFLTVGDRKRTSCRTNITPITSHCQGYPPPVLTIFMILQTIMTTAWQLRKGVYCHYPPIHQIPL